jgi:hypothetical protein
VTWSAKFRIQDVSDGPAPIDILAVAEGDAIISNTEPLPPGRGKANAPPIFGSVGRFRRTRRTAGMGRNSWRSLNPARSPGCPPP